MRNGEPWFVAKDATQALGYSNGRKAVGDHVEEHQRGSVTFRDGTSPRGGNPNLTIISEGGLYALIMGSKLPQATLFKRWVLDTVLPSIRKNGGYILGQEKVATGEMSDAELMARAPLLLLPDVPRLDQRHIHEVREEGLAVCLRQFNQPLQPRDDLARDDGR